MDGNNENRQKSLTEKRKAKAKRIVFWFSILTLGSGYILYICLRLLLYEMAKKNQLVALRTDGEIKAIMRGNTCVIYLMKIENYRIDPEGFDLFKGPLEAYAATLTKAREKTGKDDLAFVERKLKVNDAGKPEKDPRGYYQLTNELKQAIEEANSTTLFEEIFGVFWVGLSPFRVFTYPFRWLKYGQAKAKNGEPSDKVGMYAREEEVDSLFFRYTQYGIVIENAEIGAGAKLSGGGVLIKVKLDRVEFVYETITTNPHKTLFRTAALSSAGEWQQAINREIRSRIRIWLGGAEWDTLLSDDKAVEKNLKEIADEINGLDEDGLPKPISEVAVSAVRDYGQKIVKITMPNVDLNEILQKAYESVFIAEKKRDSDIARATGERALAAALVQGKADGLKLIGKIPGGKEMYMAEQLGKISVYAPGRDNMFLNVAAEITGKPSQPTKKAKGATSSSGDEENKEEL